MVRFEGDFQRLQIEDRDAGSLLQHGASGSPKLLSAKALRASTMPWEATYWSEIQFECLLALCGVGEEWRSRRSGWQGRGDGQEEARQEIAAGEMLFNTAPVTITGSRIE